MIHKTVLQCFRNSWLILKCSSSISIQFICLDDLPTEILNLIASFLSPSEAASFTLSSKRVFAKLGSKHIDRINQTKLCVVIDPRLGWNRPPVPTILGKEREAFMVLLSYDIKDMIYCYYCKKIHHYQSTMDIDSTARPWQRPCSQAEGFPRSHHYFHDNLHFSKVQYIMKQHRYGLDTAPLLKDLSKRCTLYGKTYMRQISTEARIVKKSLLLRSEYLVLDYGASRFPLSNYYEVDLCPHLTTCREMRWQRYLSDGRIDTIIDFANNTPHEVPESRFEFTKPKPCYELQKCTSCATEFQVDQVHLGVRYRNPVLIFTVWQDLGGCVTPFDEKWARHQSIFLPERSSSFQLGSIKTLFEGNSDEYTPKLSWLARKSLRVKSHETGIKTPCM